MYKIKSKNINVALENEIDKRKQCRKVSLLAELQKCVKIKKIKITLGEKYKGHNPLKTLKTAIQSFTALSKAKRVR